MFELLAGYSPFVAKNNQDLYTNIKKLKIQWPKDMPPLAKNLIGKILRETISALQYLHSFNPPIIHRDIKPENLLLNNGGRVLLADFGWSNFADGDVRKTFCGTPEYIAPEMLLKKGHDTRVDIWSVGV